MEQMYKTRREHVSSRLTKSGLTQMIVSDPLSIRYLTGVWVDPYERLYALYLRTDGKHRFFLNNLLLSRISTSRKPGFPTQTTALPLSRGWWTAT